MRWKPLFALTGTFLTYLALPASAHAQEAFTIPKSDRVISGELTLPDGFKARFVVRDGTWVTVEDRGKGGNYFFAFSGIINDFTGKPNFVPYQLFRTTPTDTEVVELDKTPVKSRDVPDPNRDIPVGRTATFAKAGGITLRVTGTGVSVFAAPYISDISRYSSEELEKEFGYSTDGICCITCQGRSVCASRVDTSCGGCDSGGGGVGGGGGGLPI